jgi:aryl-alcohol dehydrogenase-like predicted oxidoreductase
MAALGRPGYINLAHAGDLEHDYDPRAMERHAHAVLDAAWAAGVRYFDVARSYGRGEEFLASWLLDRRPAAHDCVVGSKWGYTYTAAWRVDAPVHEVKDHSVGVFVRQLAESQALLGDRLVLYQVHSATLQSGVLGDASVLRALAALRERGVAVGLTLSGPEQARTLVRAMDVRVDGVALFDTVQATWNPLETSAAGSLADAHAEGVGVIIKEALANGRLTDRNHCADFSTRLALLREESGRLGATIDAFVLAAALDCAWADVVLSGAATTAQLVSNLAAFDVVLDGQARERLRKLAEPSSDYWSARSRLPWN